MKQKEFLLTTLILVISVVAISGCTSSNDSSSEPGLNVTDLSVTSRGYGSYDITANLIPHKDYSYLEMMAIVYDSSGAVIDRSPLVWNINEVKQGQTYRINGFIYISGNYKPAKVDILIFDSPFAGGSEEGNIFKETITMG